MRIDLPSGRERPPGQPAARPLVPITLALLLGIAGSAWGLRLPGPYPAAVSAMLFSALLCLWLKGRSARLMPLAAFWLLGLALAQQALAPAFPSHHVANLPQDREIILKGNLYLPPQAREGGLRLFLEADLWLSPQGWRPACGKVLVTGGSDTPAPVEGAEVVIKTSLSKPRDPMNPGAFQRSRYWAARDIFREGHLKEPGDLIILSSSQPPGLRTRLREGLRRLLAPLDEVSQALYQALILGDQGRITPEMRLAFSRTGTSHLLAISGLHLGMLAGLGYLVAFWLLRRFPWVLLRLNAVKAAAVLAALPVMTYAWIAGGSPSTQRAEIMILAYLLLVLAGRPREVVSAMALAALVILAMSPLLLFSLSFQLSFISVAALVYVLPRRLSSPDLERLPPGGVRKWGGKALFWAKGAALASLTASLATAPLVAASFHTVSIQGPFANLAAIPLVNGLALPLGLLALTAEALHLSCLARGFLILGQFPLKLAYAAISWGAGLPGAAVILPTPTLLQMGLFYGFLLLLFLPKRTAAAWSGLALTGLLLVSSAAVPLLSAPDACELTILDSPTGLAGVLVTPDDRRLIVSAGWQVWPGREGGSVGALPGYLHWRQFRRLDEVMALSLTSRNAKELLEVARQFRLGEVWFEGGRGGEEVIELRNFLGDQGHPVLSLAQMQPPAALGAVKLTYYKLARSRVIGLGITYCGRSVLMVPPVPFDKEDMPTLMAAGETEALVVPKEPPPAWLDALRPARVIIYGRPEPDRVRRPSPQPEICLYSRQGAVTLRLTCAGIAVNQWGSKGSSVP
ncbi:MAG: ComEC/Rec2 family competence protein [Deltaproteobacteria bacterium]|nr:ComEC/Rec2 family competence protein [Deltaproteobacteria bacterium]